jgi:hypothetical protein
MSHMMISDDDMDDNCSECSYYSLPDLEDDPWLMQTPAHEVRKQAEQVPGSLPQEPSIRTPFTTRSGYSSQLLVPGSSTLCALTEDTTMTLTGRLVLPGSL